MQATEWAAIRTWASHDVAIFGQSVRFAIPDSEASGRERLVKSVL